MRPSLDPLRYGLRALQEMAREQASVAMPPRVSSEHFAPHPVLRPLARDGAALSLRLFTGDEDDATALVLGAERSRRFDPIPPRAAPLFEAHASMLAHDGGDELILGFPLVTFVQHGGTRVAPLFSRAARARWQLGDAAWKVPALARVGAPLPPPDALVLEAREDPREGDVPYALHGGIWHLLLGLDGATLAAIAAAGRRGAGPLVRAATLALGEDGEDALRDRAILEEPLTRDELCAFCHAVASRAAARRGLRCHPHGVAILPPRGDPTSGLQSELRALLEEPAPKRGPLAVYLGAPAAALRDRSVWACGSPRPTPSQLAAARAFEGTMDLVAVRGPPGCGKTALLHHVTAQTVVACALGETWVKTPDRTGRPWSLVVTSTNNNAVDHALAPFVRAPALPLALRLGNRHTLAEVTAEILARAIEALHAPGEGTLAEARAAFEARVRPVREYLRDRTETRKARESRAARREELETRAAAMREALSRTPEAACPAVTLADLDAAAQALREHAEAAARVAPLHLDGKTPSVSRACEKWARANAVRAPRIVPVLGALSLETPFHDLDPTRPHEDLALQRTAMMTTLEHMDRARDVLVAPERRRELATIEAALEAARTEERGNGDLPPDPALFDAALAVRDAWARANRAALLPLLDAALAAVRDDAGSSRGRPLNETLGALAPLFPVAGCTLLSMRAAFPLESGAIDRLVIDEAAQCAPVYAAPALARAKRAMLTGDPAQLPPVYTLDPGIDERLARGLDESAVAPFRMGATSTASAQGVAEPRSRRVFALVEHFRSQRAIVTLSSRWSGYTLDVRTPTRSLANVSRRLASPVVVLPVRGRGERAREGVVNAAESTCVVELVAELLGDGVEAGDIAVLTPFVGQCARIERELLGRGLLQEGGVLVSTVHRLQGGERRVVVFSVAATQRRHLGWLAERPHLLHVATSRAQDHLLVLVDPDAAESEPALAPLREALQLRRHLA